MATVKNKEVDKNKKPKVVLRTKYQCCTCGITKPTSEFLTRTEDYKSFVYDDMPVIPMCKICIARMFDRYIEKYSYEGYVEYEAMAIKRVCMALDVCYSKSLCDGMLSLKRSRSNMPLASCFFSFVKRDTNRDKNFDETLKDEEDVRKKGETLLRVNKHQEVTMETRQRFGGGLDDVQYLFLQERYESWSSEYPNGGKALEELLKRLCWMEWNIYKAEKVGADTTKLDSNYRSTLSAVGAMPKDEKKEENIFDSHSVGELAALFESEDAIFEWNSVYPDVDDVNSYFKNFIKTPLVNCLDVADKFSSQEEQDEFEEYFADETISKDDFNNG